MSLDKYISKVICGDCLEVLRDIPDNSVDSIATDPPYALTSKHGQRTWQYGEGGKKHYGESKGGFMGMKWDAKLPSVEIWKECLRVLKPGGHLLSFAGTRTQHRMACNIEDAGFEIRDMIAWVYGSGFPKSLDISKAIHKELNTYVEGIESPNSRQSGASPSGCYGEGVQHKTIHSPQSLQAQEWEGWGTALKPSHEDLVVAQKPLETSLETILEPFAQESAIISERLKDLRPRLEPITLARKPLSEKTVAQNVLKHGTGGINIDESRIGTHEVANRNHKGAIYEGVAEGYKRPNKSSFTHKTNWKMQPKGRFPANFIHDGSDEVVSLFPDEDGSSASRYFYTAKASRSERDNLVEGLEKRASEDYRPDDDGNSGLISRLHGATIKGKNHHPTVKPLSLMKYLVKLITPSNGIVLDPFAGTCTTLLAAKELGFKFIGIDIDPEYCKIGEARLRQEVLPLNAGNNA